MPVLRHFNTNKTNCQYEIIAHVAHFGSFGEVLDEHITEKNTFNITLNEQVNFEKDIYVKRV